MKIESNSKNIHVFRVNRPVHKPKEQLTKDSNKPKEQNPTCSRTSLSAETKRSICEFHMNNPKCTQESLAVRFGCKRSTVAKIIKCKERWLSIETDTATAKRFRQRSSRYPLVEKALRLWLQEEQDNLASVTDQMLRNRARHYAQTFSEEGLDDFKASSSWISNFKQRYITKNQSDNDFRKSPIEQSDEDEKEEYGIFNDTEKKTNDRSARDISDQNNSKEECNSENGLNVTDVPTDSIKSEPSSCKDISSENRIESLQVGDQLIDSTDDDYMDCSEQISSPTITQLEEDKQEVASDESTIDKSDTLNSTSIVTANEITKLNAKKHLEAALAFYTSRNEGTSSMSANMIRLILQNDFVN